MAELTRGEARLNVDMENEVYGLSLVENDGDFVAETVSAAIAYAESRALRDPDYDADSAWEFVDIRGAVFENLDSDIRLWFMLDAIAKTCGNPQPALRSLLWMEIMKICELRFDFYEMTDEGLLRRK